MHSLSIYLSTSQCCKGLEGVSLLCKSPVNSGQETAIPSVSITLLIMCKGENKSEFI